MANRHLSRSIVLQTLFEWDFNGFNEKQSLEVLTRNATEFAPGLGDFAFMKSLLHTVVSKSQELDEIITKAAPEWPLAKIANVDRNVLRLGLSELIFSDKKEVPPKVAINEAIELAKSFGGESSGRFVNGVLGAVYKELGEPGKDDTGKKKKEIPYEELLLEEKGGAVVYAKHEGSIYFAFVHDVFGHWTLSKGGPKGKETVEDAAVRAIKEEMDLDIELQGALGDNEYIANHPEKGKHRKHVIYYLGESKYTPVTLEECGGLDDAKWFESGEISDLNFYEDITPLVTRAINVLAGKETLE
jgi:N utilization substance protein B